MDVDKSKVLGILGGMGPMATAYFFQLVIEHTKAACDQEHIDMVISNKATTPDRSAYIMGESGQDPFAVMEAEAQRLVIFGAQVIAIPCNTAHYFYTRLNDVVPVPVLDMAALTVDKAAGLGCDKLGVLATTGTVHTETYQRACAQRGLACVVPDEAHQRKIMQVIYGNIKSGTPPDMQLFAQVANSLFAAGCQRLVLGCTELSLLKRDGLQDERYLDSLDVLAEAAIAACGRTPVGFEWHRC